MFLEDMNLMGDLIVPGWHLDTQAREQRGYISFS